MATTSVGVTNIDYSTFPKFSAYMTATTTLTVNASTKLTLTNVVYDDLTNYSTANSRFTAPYAGYYVFIGASSFNSTGTNVSRAFQSLYKNGTEIIRGPDTQATIAYGASVVGLLKLAAGDYIETWLFINQPATSNGNLITFTGYLYSKI